MIFASIAVKDKPIGTISNTSGSFDFHIYLEDADYGVMMASMLGYETLSIPINKIDQTKSVIFYMNKVPKILDEIIISDSLTSFELLDIAINKIPTNYPNDPFYCMGFIEI